MIMTKYRKAALGMCLLGTLATPLFASEQGNAMPEQGLLPQMNAKLDYILKAAQELQKNNEELTRQMKLLNYQELNDRLLQAIQQTQDQQGQNQVSVQGFAQLSAMQACSTNANSADANVANSDVPRSNANSGDPSSDHRFEASKIDSELREALGSIHPSADTPIIFSPSQDPSQIEPPSSTGVATLRGTDGKTIYIVPKK